MADLAGNLDKIIRNSLKRMPMKITLVSGQEIVGVPFAGSMAMPDPDQQVTIKLLNDSIMTLKLSEIDEISNP